VGQTRVRTKEIDLIFERVDSSVKFDLITHYLWDKIHVLNY
jgi:hypothetical protein